KIGIIMMQSYGAGIGLALIQMAQVGVFVNLLLMVLNLLPIPPLDGSRVVACLLPPKTAYWYSRYEWAGFAILIALLLLGLWSAFLRPVVMYLMRIILGFFGVV